MTENRIEKELIRLSVRMGRLAEEARLLRMLVEDGASDKGRWFKPQSAADYTDFSLSTIEKALRLGHLKHRRVKFDGQRVSVRIKREWLDQWLEKQPED